MSIDRLHYFEAVVETRNLRKASELVGISHPFMSKTISVLEEELGCNKDSENHSSRIRMGTFEVFSTYFISSFLQVEKEYEFVLLEMTPGKIGSFN